MLTYLIVRLVDAYSLIIFVYVMMSWLPVNRGILADIYQVSATPTSTCSERSFRRLEEWWT